ncbi:MAG: hypothetical protein HeimC2_11610 [Candidatus Heimdallarchaeota archaeon LC_2]|nr:MAG: hypothetical protein HeimC2_11610 [Candidatus Heimdallarchaeota archaeon LC_2]
MRKKIIISVSITVLITILVTVTLVRAAAPTTPFEYTEGDDDDLDVITSIQVPENYDGDFSEFNLITESEAKSTALSYTTGGEVKEVELETAKNNVFWEVEVKFEGNEFEIIIDAGNGDILGAYYESESLLEDWFDRD